MSNPTEEIPSKPHSEGRLWRVLVRDDLANRRVLGRIHLETMRARGCQLFQWHQDFKNPPWLVGILLFERPVPEGIVSDFIQPIPGVYDSDDVQHQQLQARHVPENMPFILRETNHIAERVWHAIIPRHRYSIMPLVKLKPDMMTSCNLDKILVYQDKDPEYLHVIFVCLEKSDEWSICADILRTHPLICLPSVDHHYDVDQDERCKNPFYLKISNMSL